MGPRRRDEPLQSCRHHTCSVGAICTCFAACRSGPRTYDFDQWPPNEGGGGLHPQCSSQSCFWYWRRTPDHTVGKARCEAIEKRQVHAQFARVALLSLIHTCASSTSYPPTSHSWSRHAILFTREGLLLCPNPPEIPTNPISSLFLPAISVIGPSSHNSHHVL